MKKENLKNRETEVIDFTYGTDGDIEGKIVLIKPNFDETVEAYKYLVSNDGLMDMITPGKIIFDLCVIECPDAICNNVRYMMSVCSLLTTTYTLPIPLQIKKKD